MGPLTMVGTTVIGQITDVPLSAGDNTIPVPLGAVAVLIVLPTAGVSELKIRTNLNPSDGGLPIGTSGFDVFSLYPGTTALIINAAGAVTGIELSFI